MSTLQSTLDSSQFGGGPGSNVTGPGKKTLLSGLCS